MLGMLSLLRLSILLSNVYSSYKTLRPPARKRGTGEPPIRATLARKRDMKACISVWIVWACYMSIESVADSTIGLVMPFYSNIKLLILLVFFFAGAVVAEPVLLHVLRPFVKPYQPIIDLLLDYTRIAGDVTIHLVALPWQRWKKRSTGTPRADHLSAETSSHTESEGVQCLVDNFHSIQEAKMAPVATTGVGTRIRRRNALEQPAQSQARTRAEFPRRTVETNPKPIPSIIRYTPRPPTSLPSTSDQVQQSSLTAGSTTLVSPPPTEIEPSNEPIAATSVKLSTKPIATLQHPSQGPFSHFAYPPLPPSPYLPGAYISTPPSKASALSSAQDLVAEDIDALSSSTLAPPHPSIAERQAQFLKATAMPQKPSAVAQGKKRAREPEATPMEIDAPRAAPASSTIPLRTRVQAKRQAPAVTPASGAANPLARATRAAVSSKAAPTSSRRVVPPSHPNPNHVVPPRATRLPPPNVIRNRRSTAVTQGMRRTHDDDPTGTSGTTSASSSSNRAEPGSMFGASVGVGANAVSGRKRLATGQAKPGPVHVPAEMAEVTSVLSSELAGKFSRKNGEEEGGEDDEGGDLQPSGSAKKKRRLRSLSPLDERDEEDEGLTEEELGEIQPIMMDDYVDVSEDEDQDEGDSLAAIDELRTPRRVRQRLPNTYTKAKTISVSPPRPLPRVRTRTVSTMSVETTESGDAEALRREALASSTIPPIIVMEPRTTRRRTVKGEGARK